MPDRRFAIDESRNNPQGQGENIVLAIARTVIVGGIRKPDSIGYDILDPAAMLKTCFLLLAASSVLNFPLVTWIIGSQIAKGDNSSLRLFAIAFLAFGFWLRRRRKKEKWAPNRPHRLDPGRSWFTFLAIREDYVYRFVDPGVVLVTGLLLRSQLDCPLLGLWLIIAALALAYFEWNLYQQTDRHEWQLGDSPKDAARDAEAMKAMAADHSDTAAAGAAMPTGMDANLAADIERRQREREGEVAQ